MMDNNYPETVGGFYFINVPRVFSMAWPVIQLFIPAATKKKIKILTKAKVQKLINNNNNNKY